jgi:hypothetical protein
MFFSLLCFGWSALSMASEPETFVATTKELGFPVIDTNVTFTRTGEHTYRVRFSNPPPMPDLLMLYTGFYFCATQRLALDAGFDRFALLPDPDAAQNDPAQGGITAFLKPGEEGSKVLEPRFATAHFTSIEGVARNCPAQPGSVKP